MTQNKTIVLDTPQQINMFRLLTLKNALKLECLGLKHSRGVSAYAIIKKEFALKGSKEVVLKQFIDYINSLKTNQTQSA